jgi:hypothetical protein
MDVKPLNTHNAITALALYRRTVQIILPRTSPPAPVSPANIIDCIEVKTATNTHTLQYNPFANPLTKEKGVFINIWF